MTAPAITPRPVLYLVPGARRSPPVRSARAPEPPSATLPAVAVDLTARVLGTLFAPVAARLALGLSERAPLLARRGRPEPWAAAIAYLLAEEARLFHYDRRTTRTSLARELGTTLPTLRRRAAVVRSTLAPLRLDLPDPDPDRDPA